MRHRKVNVKVGQGLIQILLPSAVKINPFAEKKKNCSWMITAVILEKRDFTSTALVSVGCFDWWGRKGSLAAVMLLQMIPCYYLSIRLLCFIVHIKCTWNKSSWDIRAPVLPERKNNLNGSVETIPKNVQTWLNLAGSGLLTKRAVQLDSEVQETQLLLELHCCLLGTGCLNGFAAKYLQNINVTAISPYCLGMEGSGLLVTLSRVPITRHPFISKNVKL